MMDIWYVFLDQFLKRIIKHMVMCRNANMRWPYGIARVINNGKELNEKKDCERNCSESERKKGKERKELKKISYSR